MGARVTEIVVIIMYFLFLIGIGWYFRNRSEQSERDFYVAGQTIGPFINGIALYAAASSAASYMGFIGLGYRLGLPAALTIQSAVISGWAITQFGFAAPLQRLNKFSLSDFFKARYSVTAGVIATIITLILMTANTVPQVMGGGFIMNYLTGIPYAWSVILIAFIFTLYVVMGGMYAITWTDFVQGAVAVAAFLGISLILINTYGGYGEVLSRAAAVNPDFASVHPAMPYVSYIGLFATTFFVMACIPHLVQRQLTAGSPSAGRRSMIYAMAFICANIIAYLVVIPAGIGSFPGLENPDLTIILIVENYLPAIVGGFIFAGILAAIQSTTDAGLLVIGTAISNDLYKRIKPDITGAQGIKIARLSMVAAAIVIVIFALLQLDLIGFLVALALGAFSSTFFFPLFLGIWWKGATNWGAIFSMVGGLLAFVLAHISPAFPRFSETLVGTGTSLILMVVVSMITRSSDAKANEATCEFMKELRGIEY